MANFEVPVLIFDLPTRAEWAVQYVDGYTAHLAYTTAVRVYWKTKLGEAQNWKCCWCGIRMTDERGYKHSSTIEHIVPTSKGGKNHPNNYAVACYNCNSNRGIEDIEVFLARIRFVDDNARIVTKYTQMSNKKVVIRSKGSEQRDENCPTRKLIAEELRKFGIQVGHQARLSKLKRRLDAALAFDALKNESNNPFKQDTRPWKFFERYRGIMLTHGYDANIDCEANINRLDKMRYDNLHMLHNQPHVA